MIESEKLIERKLSREVKKAGGWSIKLLSTYISGLPDRICLFPGGQLVFVELKTTGQKIRKIQEAIHIKLKRLGFEVLVVDSSQQIKKLIEKYEGK